MNYVHRAQTIQVKTLEEQQHMRVACRLAANALGMIRSYVVPGAVLRDLDARVEEWIRAHHAEPAFKGYNGFPATTCISVNEQLIHGIPDDRCLADGDIVSIDVGVQKDGFYGDVARTFMVGDVSADVQRLVATVEEAFYAACATFRAGMRVGALSAVLQKTAESRGYGVVREYVGHGIGRSLHEAPQVPNFGARNSGAEIPAGATLAIEPMFTLGRHTVRVCADGWTVVTRDAQPCAHFENTVLVTEEGCEILTEITECDNREMSENES